MALSRVVGGRWASIARGRRGASAGRWLPIAIVCTLGPAAAAEWPAYDASDASHAEIVAGSLVQAERFWPHEVALLEPHPRPGKESPLSPRLGRLIRVEQSSQVRVDFGEGGVLQLPADRTDVLERANLVRLGALDKLAPNAFVTLGGHVLESSSEEARPFEVRRDGTDSFLCVFADVRSPEFRAVAESLAGLVSRERLQVLLVPQNDRRDAQVWRRLREVGFRVPFVIRAEAKARTRALLGEGEPLPQVMLLSAEGRILYQGVWRPGPGNALPPEPGNPEAASLDDEGP